ncbi:MAG: FAD-binding oxidoreductase [Propionibacteriaceae bacterium]
MTDTEAIPVPATANQHGVQHMKWYGWGVEGISFHHEDKPNLAPFIRKVIDLDLNSAGQEPISLDDLPIVDPRISTELLTRLSDALGTSYVTTDGLERIVHTYGKSLRDLVRIRGADIPRIPDVVVYPADETEVASVVDAAMAADAVIIAFGGGSNISGSLHARPEESRPVISLDLGRLNRLIDIDEESGLARVQAGVLGPDLEAQLNPRGWTIGHFPDSFTYSTVGGWVATRSSGMQSDKYGDIADITKGLRVVQGDGEQSKLLVVRPLPSTATGPSVREMILGSEGRLGVITEVTVQVHRIAEERVILGYLFPGWSKGLAAMQAIAASDAAPIITRVSDANETAFSFSTSKKSRGVSKYVQKGLFAVLRKRGWTMDDACLSFIGYEGGTDHVARTQKMVKEIVAKHGGIVLGKGPGVLYDQKKFDTPYIRDFLLDRGAAGDVSETAAPWSKIPTLYTNTIAAANRAFDQIGVKGFIMCHLSHSYHSGACLYFTFAFRHDHTDVLARYDVVKSAIQQSFLDNGGTLSHHHAVGTEHARWLSQDISPAGSDMIAGLIGAVDPRHNFNPGKIVAD